MRAEDVIEMQGRLCDALGNDEIRMSMGTGMIVRYQKDVAKRPEKDRVAWFNDFAEDLLTRERALLPGATSFRVGKDMCTLVNAATEEMLEQDAPWTLATEPQDLPAESGFVVFEDPLLVKDELTHVRTPVKAISWHPSAGPDQWGKSDAHIADPEQAKWYSYTAWIAGADLMGHVKDMIARNQRDATEAEQRITSFRIALGVMREQLDTLPLTPEQRCNIEADYVKNIDAEALVEQEYRGAVEMMDALSLMVDRLGMNRAHRQVLVPVEFGLSACTQIELRDPMLAHARRYGNVRLWADLGLWVFWYFARQQLVVQQHTEGVARPFARRWKTKAFPKSVQVITLRRKRVETTPLGPKGTVEYSHRWWVKGHWKQQPCGPGNSLRKPIYVAGHPAGPDDKPLVLTKRVYDLRR